MPRKSQDLRDAERIIAQAGHWAKMGNRVVVNDKTWWGGLGNPSGLHSFAQELTEAKWEKSGSRFVKKLTTLKPGDVVTFQQYRNVTRDRGRWETVYIVKRK